MTTKAILLLTASVVATSTGAESTSLFGTPGLIDMPSAEVYDDGNIALTSSYFGGNLRNTLTFQITPRLQGSFRYSKIDDYQGAIDLFDRSFDLRYQIAREGRIAPSLAVGLRDFGGTGIYSSEYLVATKTVTPTVKITGGLGWGRLGERNGIHSPFVSISEDFGTRPNVGDGGISTTGQLDFGAWLKGDVALFGGVEWQATDKLTLLAEYSSDEYSRETSRGLIDQTSPMNVGLKYAFDSGIELGAYYMYGTEAGISVNTIIDPKNPDLSSGLDDAPLAIMPRDTVAAASWNQPGAQRSVTDVLQIRLADQGLTLDGVTINANRAAVRVTNTRYGAEAQALGRTMRILANTLPVGVETFDVTFMAGGVPTTTATLRRADLEQLEFALDGAEQTGARTTLTDASSVGHKDTVAGNFPSFTYGLKPYISPVFFDPDQPVRAEVGAQLSAVYKPAPGVTIAGSVRRPIYDSVSTTTRRSNSVLPRVRTDGIFYAIESDLELSLLTAEYMFRPGPDLYGRVTAGYLEAMFGGVSTELLWHPVDSRLALGAEVNYAVQRDFNQGFGFRDYEIATGHLSAYYSLENSFQAQLDVGRYLAGDWGGTFTLDREFKNGVKVGGFFTLTDVSFEDFGEGSFDKGIRIEIPLSYFAGEPSLDGLTQVIRPVQRDGGARLNVQNRLYDVTSDYRATGLDNQWGRFWR
ncbi:MAG: YjbH domain-containing protein [Yoonia sp.]|nr:YjbH domain-containing protein [Yoonia sp.]